MADVEVQTNLTATVAPTVTDDADAGYSVFSPWVDIVANRVYFCADVTAGAAVWRQVIGGAIAGGANNEVITNDGAGGLVSESGLVFDGTRLGIGMTPTYELDVRGALNTTLRVSDPASFGVFRLGGVGGETLIQQGAVADGLIIFAPINQKISLGQLGGAPERFRMHTDGKIGVSNTAPAAQLDVTAATSVVGLNIDLDGTPGDALTVTDSGSSVLFVIDGTGQVGVGTTIPNGILHLDNGTSDTDLILEKDAGTSADIIFHNAGVAAAHIAFDSNEDILIENDTIDRDIVFRILDGAVDTEMMRIVGSTSRIGIGTASPLSVLHVVGENVKFDTNPGSGFTGFLLDAGGNSDPMQCRDSSDASLFIIRQSGNVGIRNASPAAQLDVTAATSTVGINIDLDGTPGDAFTVTNSSSVVLFAVELDGETTTEFDSVFNTTEGGTARLTRRTAHETHTLAAAATSDTTTISIPSGARLLAVSFTVNATVVDSAGDDTWSAAFITGSTTTLATGISPVINTKRNLMLPDEISTGICQIRFTAQGGSFSAGVIEIVAYFESLTSLANV